MSPESLPPSLAKRRPSDSTADEATLVLTRDTSRKIVHVDMDAFYASVEQRDNPALRGRPIAVGHAEGRGVVATASYEARQYGVRSAMPSAKAKELCPHLIFVEGRMAHYKAVSKSIHEIFHRYTDIIEPISLDEAFLDVTHNKQGIALGVDVAKAIKAEIREELGLVASAGVSYNKFLAKIASDWRKPDGLCTIHPDRAIAFIDQLPIEAFWGVGPATAAKCHALGIHKAPDLRAWALSDLLRHFGQSGYDFYRFVRGIDDRPVRAWRERKSVGCERTFRHDLRARHQISQVLADLVEELTKRLERAQFVGCTLTLKLRHHDFTTKTRAYTSDVPYGALDRVRLLEDAERLLAGASIPAAGIRLMGLTVSTPIHESEHSLSLFGEESQ
ncbi:MAG: DNA polymerase IV [Sutterella wadsworthensis]|nr:DNA polymerase IV [Sutterella wadsworthensis]